MTPFQLTPGLGRRPSALALTLCLASCAAPLPRPIDATPPVGGEELPEAAAERAAIEPSASEWLARGRSALDEGQLAEAGACLERAAAGDPDLLEAHFLLGQIAERGRRFEAALGHYRAIVERAPNHRLALRALGNLLLTKVRDFAAGAALFAEALESAPFDAEWLNAQALFLWRAGDADGARARLHKLLSRTPDDAVAHETLALIALAQGERRLAELFTQRALELAPGDAIAHHCRALFLMSAPDSADRDEAAAHLERAVEIDPGLAEAWFNLGSLALAHRDHARAIQAFEKVRALDPAHPGLLLRLAWTFEGLRGADGAPRIEEAAAHYEQLLANSPQEVEALLGLANLFEGPLKALDRALPLYERALAALEPGARQEAVRQARDRLKQRIDLEAELGRAAASQ